MKSHMKSGFSDAKTPEAVPLLNFFKIRAFFVFRRFRPRIAEECGRMCELSNRAPYLPTAYYKRN